MAKTKLVNVRTSFFKGFVAEEFKAGDGKPRYSCNFLVEKGSKNDKAIEAAINEAAETAYGAKAAANLKAWRNNTSKFCYRDGDDAGTAGCEGMMVLASHKSAKTGRPTIVDRDGKTPLAQEDGKPYSGSYVHAIVEVWAQTGENPGIRCTLVGIQFSKDGEAFSGGATVTEGDFEAIEDDDTDI